MSGCCRGRCCGGCGAGEGTTHFKTTLRTSSEKPINVKTIRKIFVSSILVVVLFIVVIEEQGPKIDRGCWRPTKSKPQATLQRDRQGIVFVVLFF